MFPEDTRCIHKFAKLQNANCLLLYFHEKLRFLRVRNSNICRMYVFGKRRYKEWRSIFVEGKESNFALT